MTEPSVAAGTVTLEFDSEVASIDAIQRAAYRLSDRLSVDIRTGDPIVCTIHVGDDENANELAVQLRNEVLDQVLRERIRVETEATRNLVLALAFSQTGLVSDG